MWAHPEIFCLNEHTGEAALMAGYRQITSELVGCGGVNWGKIAAVGL